MEGSDSSREVQKTLVAVPDKVFSTMLRLQFTEGGNVPYHLSGMYKSRKLANEAIQEYNSGINRKKIYPRAPTPKKEEPVQTPIERSVNRDGEAKDIS